MKNKHDVDAAPPIAVVTGSARGIGRAIAEDLLAAGHRVVITDIQEELAATTAAELGENALSRPIDVADHASVGALIDEVEDELGPIAVWVNNAGIMPTGAVSEQPLSLAHSVIEVNFRGVVNGTRLVLPHMLARGEGTIVTVASATGTKPMAGLAVYSGTKAATIAFTRALHRELRGSGVRLHLVLPYLAATAMGAGIKGRLGIKAVTPQQVSTTVMRGMRRNKLVAYVPAFLGPLLNVAALLPIGVQDWLDDLAGSDRIGLDGDPAARAAYLAEVTREESTQR